MYKKGIISVCIFFICFAVLPQTVGVYSLEQCMKLAEDHSYILQANESDIAAAGNMASIAGIRALPKINGELASENRFLKPYSYNQTWASVYADWSLGDYIKKTDRSAIQDIETQKIVRDQNILNLKGRVASLYIHILQVQKKIEIVTQRLGFLQQHLNISKGLWQAGVHGRLDVLQTETEIVAEEERISIFAAEKAMLENELIVLLGISPAGSMNLKHIEIDSIIKIPLPEINPESIINNPLLTLYSSQIKVQEYRIEEVDAGKMPHIKLGSSYMIDGDPTNDGNYIGVNAGVSVPIYYGKEFKYKRQMLENNIVSLQSQKLDAEQELTIKLEMARNKLVKLKGILLIQYKKIEIAKSTADYAEINYKAGVATNLDYLSAQQILIDSELTTEETLLEYSMGLIDFYMITARVQEIISLGNIQK